MLHELFLEVKEKTSMQISAAIRKLRELMGESQQAFSTRLGISISGLANYELRERVPPLVVLGKLQKLGREIKDVPDAVKETINRTFLAELPKGIGVTAGIVSFAFSRDGDDGGLIFEILNTSEEYAYAMAFQHLLKQLRQDQKPAREALKGLFDAAEPFMAKGDPEFFKQCITRGRKP
jgi:transcriptional regulator with XRE-family HTH domain